MAANKTTFKPGEGGRRKGTPNKTTKEMRELLSDFISDNWYKLQDDFNVLEPKDRVQIFERLLQYILPKYQAVMPDKSEDRPEKSKLPEWMIKPFQDQN